MIKALLFDMDGTLLDTVDILAECWVRSLGKHGIKIDKHGFYKYVGLPATEIYSRITGEYNPLLFSRIHEEVSRCFEEKASDTIRLLYPDALPLLKSLKQYGIRTGIVTSSSCTRTLRLVDETGITRYIDIIECRRQDDFSLDKAELLLHAIKKIDVTPVEAIYVGDSLVDCEASGRAGVLFVLVRRPWNEYMVETGNTHGSCRIERVVDRLSEILELVL